MTESLALKLWVLLLNWLFPNFQLIISIYKWSNSVHHDWGCISHCVVPLDPWMILKNCHLGRGGGEERGAYGKIPLKKLILNSKGGV